MTTKPPSLPWLPDTGCIAGGKSCLKCPLPECVLDHPMQGNWKARPGPANSWVFSDGRCPCCLRETEELLMVDQYGHERRWPICVACNRYCLRPDYRRGYRHREARP